MEWWPVQSVVQSIYIIREWVSFTSVQTAGIGSPTPRTPSSTVRSFPFQSGCTRYTSSWKRPEVFIGSDWKRIPSFKKYSKVPPPPPHYNLSCEDLKKYYRSEFYRLASEDKIPVLGISSVFDRKLVLMTIDSSYISSNRMKSRKNMWNAPQFSSFFAGGHRQARPARLTGPVRELLRSSRPSHILTVLLQVSAPLRKCWFHRNRSWR